jgi:phospholipid/cholesterol/gamma-HCH transport system substrate-binding protein
MEESKHKREVTVGFFILLGLVFLIGGILLIGNLSGTFKKKVNIISVFDDVGGLQAGNNVWFSGVKIGTISNLQIFSQSKVRVVMKIDRKSIPYIHKDAKVKLSSEGFIGNKILIIYGGTTRSPQIEDGDSLQADKTFSTDEMMNTLQENNKNLLTITSDFRELSQDLMNGKGTIGKLLTDEDLYNHLKAASLSLQNASGSAQQLVKSIAQFTEGLNKKGTLANELTTDTVVFKSIRRSAVQLANMSDSASRIIGNLKEASRNPGTPLGVLLHDEESGEHLKNTLENLETGSQKLSEDLEALKHNFLFRGYFRKKEKDKNQQNSNKTDQNP